MTFSELQDTTFLLMRDSTRSKFSSDYVKAWLNEAEKAYSNKTEYAVKKSTSISTAVAQREYSVPSDNKLIRSVYYDGNKLKGPVDIEDTIHQAGDESGTPSAYYVELDKIGLEPIPTEIKTLTIIYYSLGGTMTAAGDSPIIPVEHHMLLVYRACYHACIEGEDDRLNIFFNEWKRGLEEAMVDAAKKNPWPQVGLGGQLEVSRVDHDLERL